MEDLGKVSHDFNNDYRLIADFSGNKTDLDGTQYEDYQLNSEDSGHAEKPRKTEKAVRLLWSRTQQLM